MYFFLFVFSLRIFGHEQQEQGQQHQQQQQQGDEIQLAEQQDSEDTEKMAAAVRSEGPSNLVEKLKVRNARENI